MGSGGNTPGHENYPMSPYALTDGIVSFAKTSTLPRLPAPGPPKRSNFGKLEGAINGWFGWSIVEGETDFDRDLPVGDLAVFDVAAGFTDFEPAEIADALGGFSDGVLDRVLEAFGG